MFGKDSCFLKGIYVFQGSMLTVRYCLLKGIDVYWQG